PFGTGNGRFLVPRSSFLPSSFPDKIDCRGDGYNDEAACLPGPGDRNRLPTDQEDGAPADMGREEDAPGKRGEAGDVRLSRASAVRLSLYLRWLEGEVREGATKVSSGQLGDAVGVSDAQVRKDLASLRNPRANLGSLGHPGIGYAPQELIAAIRRALGIDRE